LRKRTIRRRLFWLAIALGLLVLAAGGWIAGGVRAGARSITSIGSTGPRRRFHMRTKTTWIAACVAVVAAAVGGVSLVSAEGAGAGAGGKTMSLVTVDSGLEQFVDTGERGESPGDTGYFQELLYDRTRRAKAIGHSEIMCAFLGEDAARCSATFFFPEGKIEVGGAIHFRRSFRVPVLGGTGAYAGARGEVTVTEINETRDRTVIRLLP